tara:strand:+ start:115 stop:231 length:117 start_codon:yes stop_codon:yes gene_type:complete
MKLNVNPWSGALLELYTPEIGISRRGVFLFTNQLNLKR